MKFEPRGYRWRMFDPLVIRLDQLRQDHIALGSMLIRKHLRAGLTGFRRGPNKHGRHFHPLSTEVLDARRIGIDPRILRGVGARHKPKGD